MCLTVNLKTEVLQICISYGHSHVLALSQRGGSPHYADTIHLRSVEVEIESDRCFLVSVIVTSVIQQRVRRINLCVSVTYKEF